MTTAENTLKWWNDYIEQNKTYPLIAEIEIQLNLAVDSDKKFNDINYRSCCTELLCVDEDLYNFTINKPYKMVSEPDNQHYVMKDDLGNDRLLFKKFFKIIK